MSLNNNAKNSIARQLLTDSDGRVAGLDRSTWAQNVIDYEHHEIHAGSHFFLCDYVLGVGDGDTTEFIFVTPDTAKWAHITIEFTYANGGALELYTGPTGIVGGTPVTPVNNNGNSSKTSILTIIKDPSSIADDGIRVAGFLAGGNRTTGLNSRDKEVILKQNQTYLFRFTALSGSNELGYCGEWYEHTNKE